MDVPNDKISTADSAQTNLNHSSNSIGTNLISIDSMEDSIEGYLNEGINLNEVS